MAQTAECRVFGRIAPIQAEHRAIVRPRETGVEPPAELGRGLHVRHALAVDRRQDRAANQNLATGIAFAFGMAGACEQPLASGTQPRETFVDRVNARVNLLGLRHAAPPDGDR